MIDVEADSKTVTFELDDLDFIPKSPDSRGILEHKNSFERLIQHTFASARATWRPSEAEEIEAERRSALRLSIKSPVRLSDHLLVPTAANIHSKQKLLENKDKVLDDDIWGSHSPRCDVLSKVKTNFGNVKSKLHEPTSSLISSQLDLEKDEKVEINISKIKPISPTSHILKNTQSQRNAAWKKDHDQLTRTEEESPRRKGSSTSSAVQSRLFDATTSSKASTWKSKEYLEVEQELKLEEETLQKNNMKKVSKPSPHLLALTVANENAKYKTCNHLDDQASEISSSPGRKVKTTSKRLLEFTASIENGKYKPPESSTWTFNEKSSALPVPHRLLAPTAAFELARYQKPEVDIDPRELGWKQPDPKPSKLLKVEPQDNESDVADGSTKSPMKVKETSERVLMLTAAHQYHRQYPEESVISRPFSASRALSASRAYSYSRALSSGSSLLRHTSSSSARAKQSNYLLSASTKELLGKSVSGESELFSLAKVYRSQAVAEVPASLLRPTASMRFRGLPDNLSDLSEGSFEDEPKMPIDKIRPVTNTEKFLAPTLSSTLHFASELPKHKGTVRPVKSSERFLSPTRSYVNRVSMDKKSKAATAGKSVSATSSPRVQYLDAAKRAAGHIKLTRSELAKRQLKRSNSFSDVSHSSTLRDDSVSRLKKYVSVKRLIRVFSSHSESEEVPAP